MKTTSLDLRERILAAYDASEGTREEVAWRFRVSLGLVKKLLQQRRRTGDIRARHHLAGRKPRLVEHHRQRLRRLVAEKPDRTLRELRAALGLDCALPTIHYALAALGLTFKKNAVVVGQAGVGNLSVTNGGNVDIDSDPNLYIGNSTGSIGTVTIDGYYEVNNTIERVSQIMAQGAIVVANAGTGTLSIAIGGQLTQLGAPDANGIALYVGKEAGSIGLVTLIGNGEQPNVFPQLQLEAGSLAVGYNGTGTLTIANGGVFQQGRGNLSLASGTGSNATFNLNPGGTLQFYGAGNSTLQAGAGSYTFNFNGGILEVTGSSVSASVNATLAANTTVNLNYSFPGPIGSNVTFSGVLSGTGSLVLMGDGMVTLSGSNTFTGNTTNQGIRLELNNSLALQDSTLDYAFGSGYLSFGTMTAATMGGLSGNAEGIVLSNSNSAGVALTVGGNNQDTTFSGALSGAGSLIKAGSGTLMLLGVNTYAGSTTIANGTLMLGGDTGGLSGNIMDNGVLIFNQDTNSSFGAAIVGSGSVVQSGNAILTLSGDNTYTGGTTVSSGVLNILNNGTVSATGPGLVVVASGATLSGSGNIIGATTIDGVLLPGNTGNGGDLSFGSNLVLGNEAIVDFQISGTTQGSDYSAVSVGGNLSLNGTLVLNLINGYLPTPSDKFNLFSAGNVTSGTFVNFVLPDTGDGLDWNVSQLTSTGSLAMDAPTSYSAWTSDYGLSGNNALPAATPFGGDTANVIRYAMNLDTTPTPDNLPVTALATVSGVNYLTLQYRARKDMGDYQLVPQSSTDLQTWTDVDFGNITQLTDADAYTAQFQASTALPSDGPVFLRVVAEPLP